MAQQSHAKNAPPEWTMNTVSQPHPKTTALQSAAVDYAKNNWFIFPVKPKDKTPLTSHGLKDATNKVDTVREWWAKWPDANIGLNCGKSGMVVVDLDKHGEYDGMAEWDALKSRFGLSLCTSTSITGGGGRHLLFKAPTDKTIKNSAGKLSPGIDVRAEGGYIVLPPSIHPSGNSYAWEPTTTSIEDLPTPIVEILTTEPDPWKIYTLKDAARPRPPLVWVVDGIIPAGSLSIWYGAPGTLKSMILADLSVCVAGGRKWLANPQGMGGFDTARSGVMWLDFDNGSRRTHERFSALARAHCVPQDAPLYYVSMPDPTLDAGDADGMHALAQRIVNRDVALVVIDNLGVVSGNADENSADMQRPMGGLRYLTEITGAAVIVLHHQRKANGNTKDARAGETLRGHGSIEAKLDLGMLITRDGTNIILSATKERGPDVKSFGATFSFENDSQRELVEARFWPYDPTAEDEEELENLKANVLEYIRRNPGDTATAVYNDVGGQKQKVFDAIRILMREKKIYELPGAGNSKKLFIQT